jgi:hypothetical protein
MAVTKTYIPKWTEKEISIPGPVKRGQRGKEVKKVQEWLSFSGFGLKIDGIFGPATENALKRFQEKKRLQPNGVCDVEVYEKLIQPLKDALNVKFKKSDEYSKLVVNVANRHLQQNPHEIGGDNRGPWVRLYMGGHEGRDWFWCAGFVTFIHQQAAHLLEMKMPLKQTFSCDELANHAKQQGTFVSGKNRAKNAENGTLQPGCLFLNCKSPGDWTHTGIVTAFHPEHMETIEGNTNIDGSRNGIAVFRRFRKYSNSIDYISI